MTEGDLLGHIFERLCRADSGQEIFGADEATQWPGGALEVLIKSGLVIECDGCERNCFMPVHVRPAESNRPARAFISCEKPEDVGRVPVELGRLAQWRITGGMLAGAMARLLGFTKHPHEDSGGKQVATDPRRFSVVEPPPFAPQFLEAERPNAIDLALDRSGIHRSHG